MSLFFKHSGLSGGGRWNLYLKVLYKWFFAEKTALKGVYTKTSTDLHPYGKMRPSFREIIPYPEPPDKISRLRLLAHKSCRFQRIVKIRSASRILARPHTVAAVFLV